MGDEGELSQEFVLLFSYQMTTRYFTASASATTTAANKEKIKSNNYVCRYMMWTHEIRVFVPQVGKYF